MDAVDEAHDRIGWSGVSSYRSHVRAAGAVAITVTTTALDRVSGVVCGDACVPGFGCGLARESVGGVCTGSRTPFLPATGKKTPGGAGTHRTHTGHEGAQGERYTRV